MVSYSRQSTRQVSIKCLGDSAARSASIGADLALPAE
jgi:hypothetical protein